jgi:hypothetical protein
MHEKDGYPRLHGHSEQQDRGAREESNARHGYELDGSAYGARRDYYVRRLRFVPAHDVCQHGDASRVLLRRCCHAQFSDGPSLTTKDLLVAQTIVSSLFVLEYCDQGKALAAHAQASRVSEALPSIEP